MKNSTFSKKPTQIYEKVRSRPPSQLAPPATVLPLKSMELYGQMHAPKLQPAVDRQPAHRREDRRASCKEKANNITKSS